MSSSKRSHQPSNSVAAGSDSPFVPHRTWSGLYALPSACACGLSRNARVLIVGDGDLSYSVGLMRHWRNASHNELSSDTSQWYDNAQAINARQTDTTQSHADEDDNDPTVPIDPSHAPQLTCTTYEPLDALAERYTDAPANAALLRSWGVKVLHGVDARKLEEYTNLMPHSTATIRGLPIDLEHRHGIERRINADIDTTSAIPLAHAVADACTFHYIAFHFPHVGGKSRIHLNRALLCDFLKSAETRLVRTGDLVWRAKRVAEEDIEMADASPSTGVPTGASSTSCSSWPIVESAPGCIHVSLIRGQGGTPCDTKQRPMYGDHWQILECAAKADLVLTHVFPFGDGLYRGYNNRGFRSRDEEFWWRGVAITHVLTKGAGVEQVRLCQETSSSSASSLPSIADTLLARPNLTLQPNHPIAITAGRIEEFWRTHGQLAVNPSLAAIGCTKRPFIDCPSSLTTSPIISRPTSESLLYGFTLPLDKDPAYAVYLQQFPHVSINPYVEPVRLDNERILRSDLFAHLNDRFSTHQQSSSSFIFSGPVYEQCSTIDSLQWNLEPVLSATADMEKQLTQPIGVKIAQGPTNGDGTNIFAASAATPLAASANATISAPSSSPSLPDAVPFLRGGVSVLHHSLTVQLFSIDSDHAKQSKEVLHSSLQDEFESTAMACARSMFPGSNDSASANEEVVPLIRVRPLRPCTMSTNSTIVHLSSSVQVFSLGVWHVVGRGGILLSDSPSTHAVGFLIEWSLEKLAMLIYGIADLRWFWSRDSRFLRQFTSAPPLHSFVPFSIHPLCYVRDTSFWLYPSQMKENECENAASSSSSTVQEPPSKKARFGVSHSDAEVEEHARSARRVFIRLVNSIVGPDRCGSVTETDSFTHPQRGRAMRFRLIYNSVDRTMSPSQVQSLQQQLHSSFVQETGVEMR